MSFKAENVNELNAPYRNAYCIDGEPESFCNFGIDKVVRFELPLKESPTFEVIVVSSGKLMDCKFVQTSKHDEKQPFDLIVVKAGNVIFTRLLH